MTIYYVKQDNTIWGCGDPECCGEWYEEIDETFVNCECEHVNEHTDMVEHLQSCVGGGPVLKWRKAKRLEIQAFIDGKNEGFGEGWNAGEKYEQEYGKSSAE
jgi:hypothetical protein